MVFTRLKELRESLGLNQRKLADKVNIARTTYTNYENGNREPDFETICKLADFHNVLVDYILGRIDIKNIHSEISCADIPLSAEEHNVLQLYNQLTERQKGYIEGQMKAMSEMNKTES